MDLKQIRTGFWGRTGTRAVAVTAALLVALSATHCTPKEPAATATIAPANSQQQVAVRETSPQDTFQDKASVPLSGLPVQGRQVMDQIYRGGPFAYDKDGTVFGNRERLLPTAKRGYYREYTVPTPGVNHRGARRIVCGGLEPKRPDACYYSADHYASFRQIVVQQPLPKH